MLNEINHSKDPEQLRYHVMASKERNKIKDRISLPAEKLFILVRHPSLPTPMASPKHAGSLCDTAAVVRALLCAADIM